MTSPSPSIKALVHPAPSLPPPYCQVTNTHPTQTSHDHHRPNALRYYRVLLPLFFISALYYATSCYTPYLSAPLDIVSPGVRPCHSLPTHLAACQTLPYPTSQSLLTRQHLLAETLLRYPAPAHAVAYIAEPSPNTLYYFNLTPSDWHLSERAFLIALVPTSSSRPATDSQEPKSHTGEDVFVIVPSFEQSRAQKQLDIRGHNVTFLTWEESESPYAKLKAVLDHRRPSRFTAAGVEHEEVVVVDENLRAGIGEEIRLGLERQTIVSSGKTREIRERKSREELDLLRCANQLTLHAIRSTRDRIRIGMSETKVSHLLDQEFVKLGIDHHGSAEGLILFGENAALPHGSSSTRSLRKDDFVLIDAGGTFRGYVADITRTFALDDSRISKKNLDIWALVHRAQSAAYAAVELGVKASAIDQAARKTIEDEGFGPMFTHRLGHGIGLEGHEAPYLHAGNKDVTILSGNSFSNEPGVYIEGQVGVRLEDCWYMDEEGRAVAFTPQANSPWVL